MIDVRVMVDDHNMLLDQAYQFIQTLPDKHYCDERQHRSNRIGPHMRHVFDYYDCLVAGLSGTQGVDFSQRSRDTSLETDKQLAMHKTREIQNTLSAKIREPLLVPQRVPVGDTFQTINATTPTLLDSVRSHTIHHYAIIRVLAETLYDHHTSVDRFGYDPSNQ